MNFQFSLYVIFVYSLVTQLMVSGLPKPKLEGLLEHTRLKVKDSIKNFADYDF